MDRRRLGGLLGLVLTCLFAGLAVYRLDLRQVGAALVRANYLYVAPALFFTFWGYLLRTARWRVILLPRKEASLFRLFPVLIIGFAVNNLLPARLGEFARAYMLGQKENISKSLSFATVVVERLLDGLTLLVFLLALSFFFPLPGWGQRMGFLAALFFLGALAFLFLLLYREVQAFRLVKRISSLLSPSWADSLERLLTSFVAGVESLRQRHLLPGLALLSVSVWAFEATSYLFLTWAFPISLSPLSRVMAALFVTVVVNLGVLIPSSPGYVGTFHFFAMSALSVFGVGREVALSYAVVSHAMQYVLITGLGLYFLWRENLSLARLGAAATSEAKG